MSEELKKQASDLYRQRDELGNLRTSEGLSMKKTAYVSIAIVLVILAAVAIFGGFKRRQNPIIAATKPPELAKEAPPAELLAEAQAPATPAQPAPVVTAPEPLDQAARPEPAREASPQAAPPAPSVGQPPASAGARRSAKPLPEPAAGRPTLAREVETVPPPKPTAKPATSVPKEPQAPAKAPEPVISELERTRRELAREIVLEKHPALSELVAAPGSRDWGAEPIGPDEYTVSFLVVDKSSGAPVQYVWRVNVAARTVTPLSYYARRLS